MSITRRKVSITRRKKQIAQNMAKAEASGFRLQYGRSTPELATCKADDCVIFGGLGAFGCGIMAFNLSAYSSTEKDTPDFPTTRAANEYVRKTYGFGAINLELEAPK